jgi:hypothetical protein
LSERIGGQQVRLLVSGRAPPSLAELAWPWPTAADSPS